MSAPAPGLWALIPAHNEAATIRAVVDGVAPHVTEVVVIDDGSDDATAETLAGSPVRLIRHSINAGKGPRLCEGLDLAFAEGAEAVITLDADGQHDPADIPAFASAMADAPGALILGDRSADMMNMPASRARGIRFGNFFISWACAARVTDAQCGMRLYPRALWEVVALPERDRAGFVFETAILMVAADRGIPFRVVPVAARYGTTERPSHFRPVRDFARITSCVTRFLIKHRLRPRGLLIALGLRR